MSDSDSQIRSTTIEEDTRLTGTLCSEGAVLVRGTVEGEITAPSLTITQTGKVVGQVRVQQLHSAGVLEGRITADTVRISGAVRDNSVLHAQLLEVNPERRTDPEFVVFGDCTLNVGDEPSLRVAPVERASAAQPMVAGAVPVVDLQVAPASKAEGASEANANPVELAAV